MSNYLETLVEKMVADGVSEQDIKSVIEEVNAKKSPLKQDIAGTVTQPSEDEAGIETATLPTEPTVRPTTVQPTVGETEEEVAECPEGYYWDEDRGTCYREDAKVTDEDEEQDAGDYEYDYIEDVFEEELSDIEEISASWFLPSEKPSKKERRNHKRASKSIYDQLEFQSEREEKAFNDYLAQNNIIYDADEGFKRSEEGKVFPDVEVSADATSGLESIYDIYEGIGGEDPEVLEELQKVENEVEDITLENNPEIGEELLENYFNIDAVERPTETRVGRPGEEEPAEGWKYYDNYQAYKNTLDEDLKNAWGEEKYSLYEKYKNQEPIDLLDIFPQEHIDNAVTSKQTRLIENRMKASDIPQDEFSIMMAVWSTFKGVPGTSYSLEYLLSAYRDGKEDEKIIYDHFQKRFLNEINSFYFRGSVKRNINRKGKKLEGLQRNRFTLTNQGRDIDKSQVDVNLSENFTNEEIYDMGLEAVKNGEYQVVVDGVAYWVVPTKRKYTTLEGKRGEVYDDITFCNKSATPYGFSSTFATLLTKRHPDSWPNGCSLNEFNPKTKQYEDRMYYPFVYHLDETRAERIRIEEGGYGDVIAEKATEKLVGEMAVITGLEKQLNDRVKDYEENYAPVIKEVLEITDELNRVFTESEFTDIDVVYSQELFKRLDELQEDYQIARTAHSRLMNLIRGFKEKGNQALKNLDLIKDNVKYYKSWSKNYKALDKMLGQVTILVGDIITTLNLLGGDAFIKRNMELKEAYHKEFPGEAQWGDDVGWWTYLSDVVVGNTGNIVALMAATAGGPLGQAIFFAWTAGGELTTRTSDKINAAKYKEQLKKDLKNPNLSEAERGFLEDELLTSQNILNRSGANDRLFSIIYGGITTITERFGSIAILQKWRKWKPQFRSTFVQNLKEIGKFALKGTGIETFEEYLDQAWKNVADKINPQYGKHVSVWDGMDANFFANVTIFSLMVQSAGARNPIFLSIRNAWMTKEERKQLEELLQKGEEIEAEIAETQRSLVKLGFNQIDQQKLADLRKELAENFREIEILDRNIVAKIDLVQDTVDDNGNVIETKEEKIKRIFDLARRKEELTKDIQVLASTLDFGKRAQQKYDEIEAEYIKIQAEIDAFFETESLEKTDKEKQSLEPKRQALLTTYQVCLDIAKKSKAGKGNVKVIKDFVLDTKTETEIRKQLKNRGFTDSQIEKEIQELRNSIEGEVKDGKIVMSTNAYVSPLTGDIYINEDFILWKIENDPSYMSAADAAVSPLHEIFHNKHIGMGLIDKDGLIKEEYRQSVEELKALMKRKLDNKDIEQDVYDHFIERLERYKDATQTEELLNIIGDLMMWGGIQGNDFNQLFGLKLMLNSLVRKLSPESMMFLNFDNTDTVFNYISKFHTDSKKGFIDIPSDIEESEIWKHSLSSEEQVELQEIQSKIRERNDQFLVDIQKIKDEIGLHTAEGKKQQQELREKKDEDIADLNIRKEELSQTTDFNQKLSLEARSLLVQKVYESDLSQTEKENRILELMQPYITTTSKVWDFSLAKTNKEQAYTFADFRRDLEYWVVKHVQQYNPDFGQTLSSYIMHNTKLKVPGLLDKNLVDNPVDIDNVDIIDDYSEGAFDVSTMIDQEINSKLRKAFNIRKGDPNYQKVLNDVSVQVLKNIPGAEIIVNNVAAINQLEITLEQTKGKKARDKIIQKIEQLESQNNAMLEEALNTPEKRKKFRETLRTEFTKAFRDIVKQAIVPSNRRKTDETFKAFLINNKKLIIDLLAVKHKKRLPELSINTGRRYDRELSIEAQTSLDGPFIDNIDQGGFIFVRNYDMSDEAFVELFTGGRETRYNALLDELAAELGLDAVFTTLPNQLETITGKIVETIKRDPFVKFSKGKKFYFSGLDILKMGTDKYKQQVLQISAMISRSSFEDVIDLEEREVRGFEGKFERVSIETIISSHGEVDIQMKPEEIKFKRDIMKWANENGHGDIADLYKKDGALRNNENIDENKLGALDRQFEGMKNFILGLGWEAYNFFGKKMFNFTRRGMNDSWMVTGPKRRDGKMINGEFVINKFSKDNQSGGASMVNSQGSSSYLVEGWTFNPETGLFIKDSNNRITSKDPVGDPNIKAKLVRGPFYERRIALEKQLKKENKKLDIEIVKGTLYNSAWGLMNNIYNNVLAATDYKGTKEEIQQQKLDRLEELYGDKIREANEFNIKMSHLLANETISAVKKGDISPIAALHFLQAQTSLDSGFRALTSLDLITIEGVVSAFVKKKGEHIHPNGNTMFELAKLVLQAKTLSDADIEIGIQKAFSGHSQWLSDDILLDIMDKLLGKNSTLGWDRLKSLTQDALEKALKIGKINKKEYKEYSEVLKRFENTTYSIDGRPYNEVRAEKEAERNLTILELELKEKNRKEKTRQDLKKKSLGAEYNGATVLDFDLTAGESANVVVATSPDGKTTRDLDGKKWAEDGDRLLSEGWTMDFSDFDNVTSGKEGPVFPYLIKQLIRFGSDKVYILTARASGAEKNIFNFLNSRIDIYNKENNTKIPHLKLENIKGLGDSTGEAKADWIEENLVFNGINDIIFIDDHQPNVDAVQKMMDTYPDGFFKDGGKSILTRANKANTDNKIIFLVGGPGSGKSNITNQLGLGDNYVVLNPDAIMEPMLKKAGLPLDQSLLETKEERSQWAKIQQAAIKEFKAEIERLKSEGKGIVIDGTGASSNVMQKRYSEFTGLGYDIAAIFVNTSLETALDRNSKRERVLRESIVTKTWESVQKNIELYKKLFGDNFFQIDTDNLGQFDVLPETFVQDVSNFTLETSENIKIKKKEETINDVSSLNDNSYNNIKTSRGHRLEYEKLIAKNRPDLVKDGLVSKIVDDMFTYIDHLDVPDNKKRKYEKITTKWLATSNIKLNEDAFKIKDAVELAEKHKEDIFSYDNPNEIIEKYAGKAKAKPTNPNKVEEFGKGMIINGKYNIVAYEVQDTKEGMAAVREVVDTHFGPKSNPWCIISRSEAPVVQPRQYGYELAKTKQEAEARKKQLESEGFIVEIRDRGQNIKDKKEFQYELSIKEMSEGPGIMDDAWTNWMVYRDGPKRIIFQDGKLISFYANDQYWDRMDNDTDHVVITKKKGNVTEKVELVPTGQLGQISEFVRERRTVSKDKNTVTTEILYEKVDVTTGDVVEPGTTTVENRIKGVTVKKTVSVPAFNRQGKDIMRVQEIVNYDKKGKAVNSRWFDSEGNLEAINMYNKPFGDISPERAVKEKGDAVQLMDADLRAYFAESLVDGKIAEIGFRLEKGVSLESVIKTSPNGELRLDFNKVLEADINARFMIPGAKPTTLGGYLMSKSAKPVGKAGIPPLRSESVKKVLDQLDMKSDVQANRQYSKSRLSKDFNNILEESFGVGAEKTYSEAKGRLVGKKKGKWDYFGSPGIEDFAGLVTYAFAGKGKQGEAHKKFFEEALQQPFNRAYNEIHSRKQRLSEDYKALREQMPNVSKKLSDKVDGVYDVGQAIRVYLWNKSGYKIPGLSKTDLGKLTNYVQSNPELIAYANKLSQITMLPEGYIKPKDYWLGESITADMNNVVDRVFRKEALAEFIENREAMFGKWVNGKIVGENMNKIESLKGPKHREALENMLWRMENGTNRMVGSDSNVNRWMNWVNSATGTIMFFNQKSAMLQTISSLNYVNGSFNNPFRAAQAFANQPQYWKDFAKIFNSDMLVQRRGGLKINIEAAELIERVGGGEGGFAKFRAFLLEKGFIPTKYADSFAIASGGATFYRNSVRKYKKQINPETGKKYTEKEAEAKAWEDFAQMTEATQQSARPDLISMQQASALGRPILAFANTPIQMFRRHKRRLQDIKNNRGNIAENILSSLYYGFAQTMIFSYLANAMFAVDDESTDPDDIAFAEKKKSRHANTIADSYLRGMGTVGAGVSAIKNGIFRFFDERERDDKGLQPDYGNVVIDMLNVSPMIGSKARKLYGAGKSYMYDREVMEGMGLRLDNPATLALANVISATTNIPTDRAVMKMLNIKDASNSDFETWQRIAMLCGLNKWALGIEDEKLEAEMKAIEKKVKKEKKKELDKDQEEVNKKLQKQEKKEGKTITCAAVSKKGTRCRNEVLKGKSYCTIHVEVEQSKSGEKKQCKKRKSNGKRCKMQTSSKSGYCYYHD